MIKIKDSSLIRFLLITLSIFLSLVAMAVIVHFTVKYYYSNQPATPLFHVAATMVDSPDTGSSDMVIGNAFL